MRHAVVEDPENFCVETGKISKKAASFVEIVLPCGNIVKKVFTTLQDHVFLDKLGEHMPVKVISQKNIECGGHAPMVDFVFENEPDFEKIKAEEK
ncbi:hypothetical protein HN954_01535 [bacterium]|jgi:hypothetical protein|nr:hypothetical protein [bacterium]MBT6832420.1 hypothetical protein [bacterium]MBT6996091.1 hypothetical protein [bacterium]MBT7772540.1 hypothetical protein [bacterium]